MPNCLALALISATAAAPGPAAPALPGATPSVAAPAAETAPDLRSRQDPDPGAESTATVGPWPAGASEIAILVGFARGKVIDPQRTPTDFAEILIRWALHFPPTFSGWKRGNFAVVFEGVPLFTIDQEPRATGAGINLLARYTFTQGRWRPQIVAGAGVLATNEKVPPGETTLNFSPQGGLGLQYLLRPRLAIGGEYRFHHISNNGKTETNPGINTHLLLFGISWYR